MILTSLTRNAPHTAGGTRPRRRPARQGIDWTRVEQLYAFACARAQERLDEATRLQEAEQVRTTRAALRTLESMYTLARRSDATAACAITYFRVRAMRDAHHPDFLGEWLGRPLTCASAS